jgi:hypothetical protein
MRIAYPKDIMSEMINNLRDSNVFLYHYTSIEKARLIIGNKQLRMSPFRKTNDPRESGSWIFDLGSNSKSGFDGIDYATTQKIADAIRDHARVVCFCRDNDALTGSHLVDINKRGYSKPRMWAQYGDSHKGVCLVFNKNDIELQVKKACDTTSYIEAFGGCVNYIDRSSINITMGGPFCLGADHLKRRGFEEYWKDHAQQYHKELYYEKMTDWANENEFRYVALFNDEPDVYINLENALSGVVFGYNAPEDGVTSLKRLLHNCEEYIGLTWRNGCPEYDFGNPLYSGVPRFFAN